MPQFPQKRNVNVAAAKNRLHDLSHAHLTTIDFGRFKTVEMRYMVPGDEFNCNVSNETRVLSNMPCPTYGKFDLVYRGFFVPISHIWKPFYDYLKNQQSSINGQLRSVTSPPYTYCNDLTLFFVDNSTVVESPVSDADYDFKYNNTFYALTRKGRIIYDFITSLGLNFNFSSDTTKKINVLPIIAFWKLYYDWIVPSRFIHNHQSNVYNLISQINNYTDYHFSKNLLTAYLLIEPLCYYQSDLFNSLTEDAFIPSEGNLQDDYVFSQPGGGSYGDALVTTDNNNVDSALPLSPFVDLVSENKVFNMYTLQTLGKLQALLNRNLIAGNKIQDWLLTEFGLRPSDDALQICTYLGSKNHTLSISDVISTADTSGTDGVGLGSYGGYVKNQFNFDFSYKAKEHGYFFITFELVPRTNYYQGLIPEFGSIKRLDFFQPEFDNQQGEPYTFGDLFYDSKGNISHQNVNEPFGFGLQYGKYKFATDRISGDFRNRLGKNMRSWFLVRDMEKYARVESDVDFIDEEFCLVKSKYQDWNYIFADTSDEYDHFLCMFYLDMPCKRPMKSIAEGFEPTYQNSGKDVSLNFNGSVQS